MGSKDQALIVHSKKGRRENHHHQGKHSHQKDNFVKKDPSKLRCYTCDERGHFARDCPMNKSGSKKKKNSKRIHHAHTAADDDPPRKRIKHRDNFRGEFYPSGLFFHVFLPKKICHFAFFEALFCPILMGKKISP